MQNPARERVIKRPSYAVGSVDSALQLLDLLMDDNELTITGAAETLHVARSTAHRLLSTLVYRGFAERTSSRTYVLGQAGRDRGEWVGDRLLVARVRPVLQRLAAETGETASLVELRGLDARFLVSAEGTHRVRVSGRAGTVLPAHLTSATKPCLAMLPWEQVQVLLTSRAARDSGRALHPAALEALRVELAEVRRTGIARNHEATEADLAAVGAAIRGDDGRYRYGISVSAPAARAESLGLTRATEALRAAVEAAGPMVPVGHGA